jgi:hypothetical protein
MPWSCQKENKQESTQETKIVAECLIFRDLTFSEKFTGNTLVLGISLSEKILTAPDFRTKTRWGSKGLINGITYQSLSEVSSSTASGFEKTNTIKGAMSAAMSFPAVKWVTDYHPDNLDYQKYYLPTVSDFNSLVIPHLNAVNAFLKVMEKEEISGWYWTSDLASDDEAWAINVNTKEVEKRDRNEFLSVLPLAEIPQKGTYVGTNTNTIPNPDPAYQPPLKVEQGMIVYIDDYRVKSVSFEKIEGLYPIGIAFEANKMVAIELIKDIPYGFVDNINGLPFELLFFSAEEAKAYTGSGKELQATLLKYAASRQVQMDLLNYIISYAPQGYSESRGSWWLPSMFELGSVNDSFLLINTTLNTVLEKPFPYYPFSNYWSSQVVGLIAWCGYFGGSNLGNNFYRRDSSDPYAIMITNIL